MNDNQNQSPENEKSEVEITNDNGNSLINTIESTKFGKLKHISIVDEMEKSYLDYAMSVIVQRALPDVRDGLKPVHRRILYSMYKTGIHHKSSYKKSARIVGDVLGKYHPHGDAPVYMALVRLAQFFSMRYPLIDGQGNFGSIDGDSPAAMRYTEARLEKISQELLVDLNKKTVPMVENFDGSLVEPTVLPAKLPNLLLAGSEGIAVGMATKIPPHNLTEVCSAILEMIEKGQAITNPLFQETLDEKVAKVKANSSKPGDPKTKKPEFGDQTLIANELVAIEPDQLAGDFSTTMHIDDIMTHVKGPDFPTAGIIYDFNSIKETYRTGKGGITIRGKASIEETKKGDFEIIVTELPYQVNKAKLIQNIARLVKDSRIDGIRNVRDDSDRKGLQVTVQLKKSSRPKVVLNKLFKYTRLQTNFSMNMVALNSKGTPQLMNINQVLKEYIVHRQLVVVKRSQFELKEACDRAHILEGLLIALANLDDVIETIRKSKDTSTAHEQLMKKFGLSDPQATAILDMQLKRLAALERQKIEDEYAEIKKTIDSLILLLTKPKKILNVIVKELKELVEIYQDKRRTRLVKGKIGEFNEEDLIANERTVINLTESGYIKRLHPSSFRSQSRGGKGAKGISMKEEDVVKCMLTAETHDNLLFFTNRGRVFKLKAYEIPQTSRQAKGKAIVNLLNLKSQETIQTILIIDEEKDGDKFISLVTRKGLVKKTAIKLYSNIRQNGIIAIILNDGDELVWGKVTSGSDDLMVITNHGKSIRFGEKQVKSTNRDTKGVKGITLKPEDYVVDVVSIEQDTLENKKAHILIVTENGLGKKTLIRHYPTQKRSGLGVKVSVINKKTGKVASAKLITDQHKELVILTKGGQAIKIPITKKSIPTLGRATQGVILMKLKGGDRIATAALTIKEVVPDQKKE